MRDEGYIFIPKGILGDIIYPERDYGELGEEILIEDFGDLLGNILGILCRSHPPTSGIYRFKESLPFVGD